MYGIGQNGELGTGDNNKRNIFTRIGREEIITNPKEINIPVGTTKDIVIAFGNTFNIKTDIIQNVKIQTKEANNKELSVAEIPDIDNSNITNINEYKANYKLTGNKIGRTDLIVISDGGYTKNLWVNVVNDENGVASAKVVNGNEFTVALRADGTVWQFGKINNKNNPEKIQMPEEILDISAGENHVLLLGKTGTVYSFGENSKGELGSGNTTTYKLPIKLNLEKITKIIANKNISYAINKEGKVYAWGEGYSKTPTLQNKNKNIIDITKNYYLADDGKIRRLIDDTEVVNAENAKIVQISEGTDSLLLLTESGNVYNYKQEMTKILENVVEISCGDKYAVAVKEDGSVYTWGDNTNQKLGINNNIEEGGIEKSESPILKEDMQDITRVSAGYVHTTVYKKDGQVYTWGKGLERKPWKCRKL